MLFSSNIRVVSTLIGGITLQPDYPYLQEIVGRALSEDGAADDVTGRATLPDDYPLTSAFCAKEEGVIAGLEVARLAFVLMDSSARFSAHAADGARIEAGMTLATVEGSGQALLAAERVALNFLQRMSGIATLTRRFVDTVAGTKAVILDTRKTAPGLRLLDKWAVRLGGGQNHRLGLHDMVLIKDNHITAVGGIREAVARVRQVHGHRLPVEVEVKNLAELAEALPLDVARIMLDNMSPEAMAEAVRQTHGRVPLEASGNVTLANVAAIAATGVDFISVGVLTHSAPALDISLKVIRL
jgi:nicotinate-nucleotide pyrophosphorylase (carboxylating)